MTADLLPVTATDPWPLRDYVSPNLRAVHPDAAFPHMIAGDPLHHPWKYLRRDVPHIWYCDERFPLMGFLNRDEAVLLHNIALQFAGKRALEIGSWLGWSTCHLALAGVTVDVIDPAHEDPVIRGSVEQSLVRCGVSGRVKLAKGRSPESIAKLGGPWSLFFVDGDHEGGSPLRDAMACLPYAAQDCAFVFHDLAAPAVAAGVRYLEERGFNVLVYQTAQIMAMAWRGDVVPVAHVPDPEVAWQLPPHLAGLPISGVDVRPEPPRAIRNLRDVLDGEAAAEAVPRVCIVTSELIGLFKNGGIGTATTGLAELLATSGSAKVTVLYTGPAWTTAGVALGPWRERYAELGIELEALPAAATSRLAGAVAEYGYIVPWLVHRYLAERAFDVVHFNDCCGEGSVALAAKALGIAFDESLLVVGLHSPSRWVIDANETLPASPTLAVFDYGERLSVSAADVLWSPSRYLLDWAGERGFAVPGQTFVQQYTMPLRGAEPAEVAYGARVPVSEIVFFGRLEERKGLRVFCNALHVLRDELAARGITVTLLGKPETCAGMNSAEYIARRAESWRFPVRTVTELGQPEALAYLRGGGKLAVMPSPLDNSPCTVYEALACGIPFVASRTGGIPELIDRADHDRVLFEYGTEGVVKALRGVLEQGGTIARPAVPQDETRRAWRAMHARWRELLPVRRKPAPLRRTLAAIVDHPPGAALNVTLDSLSKCPSIQRFVVINRGGEPLPLTNVDLTVTDAAAFAADVAAIVEDVVLLIHSGVGVVPEEMEAMLHAMDAGGADGLQPAGRVVSPAGTRVIPPLGGCATFSFLEGATYTGALAVRRELLGRAVRNRAFTTDTPFMGLADFCVTRAENILPYPEIVTERDERCRVETRSSAPARIAAYQDLPVNDRYYMLAAGYGATGQQRGWTKRQLARAAAEAGFSFAVRIGSGVLRRLRRWARS